MTYKEAICNGLETFMTDRIELPDGTVQEPFESLPITTTVLFMSVGALLCTSVFMNKEDATASDCISILGGGNFLEHASLHATFNKFMRWLLKEEAPILFHDSDDEDETVWYDAQCLFEKWNEWVQKDAP